MNALKTDMPHMAQPAEKQQRTVENPAQRKWLKWLAVAAIIAIGIGAIGMAYIWFAGGSGDASVAITAPSLPTDSNDTRLHFSIVADDSEARFIIDETLLGSPKTVVGSTQEVAGDLLVDFENPENSQLGTVRINVRTLQTDNEFRNRALRGQILQTDQPEYEFAEFTPTALLQLPAIVTVGEPFDFQIKGNLTVHGVTREVTFDATLTPVTETRLEGSTRATIMYQDFGMTIPKAPGVANVSDDVQLEIDFVAQAANN